MTDSIRDRLKSAEDAPAVVEHEQHGEHPVGDPVVDTHVSLHGDVSDPARAKRAERAVSFLFLLSVIGVVGFIVTFVAFPWRYGDGQWKLFTPVLGSFFALALIGIGAGAVLWAKTLMVDDETIQERHLLESDEQDKAEAAAAFKQGVADLGIARRPLLRNSLLLGAGALAVLPVPLVFSLGRFQFKEAAMGTTAWRKGMRLLDQYGVPVKIGDLEVGGIKTVYPDTADGRHRGDSPSLLIRMRPQDLHVRDSRKNWVVDGHIVYSIICTHLGCPVKLYEQQTHHLFCPCHQSTFDAANGARVVFGPAARPLPQLAIALDTDGYFIAQGDFSEPVGPSYWERKPHYKDEVGKA